MRTLKVGGMINNVLALLKGLIKLKVNYPNLLAPLVRESVKNVHEFCPPVASWM